MRIYKKGVLYTPSLALSRSQDGTICNMASSLLNKIPYRERQEFSCWGIPRRQQTRAPFLGDCDFNTKISTDIISSKDIRLQREKVPPTVSKDFRSSGLGLASPRLIVIQTPISFLASWGILILHHPFSFLRALKHYTKEFGQCFQYFLPPSLNVVAATAPPGRKQRGRKKGGV